MSRQINQAAAAAFASSSALAPLAALALAMFSMPRVGTTPTLSFAKRSTSSGLGLLSLLGWRMAWLSLYLLTLSR